MVWSPAIREIYKVDLAAIMHNAETSATHRICVVLEVDAASRRMLVIFTSWDHCKEKCRCIQPGTEEAAPFGMVLRKPSHFSARNVAYVSFDKIVERIGDGVVTVDEYDRFDEVAQFAILNARSKNVP